MHEELIFGILAWLFKEAYQTFLGYRRKNADALERTERDLLVVKVQLGNALDEIKKLEESVSFLRREKREYRD